MARLKRVFVIGLVLLVAVVFGATAQAKVKAAFIISNMANESQAFSAVIPGLTFAEKDGTIVNFQGKEQKLRRVIGPVGQSLSLAKILSAWNASSGATTVADAVSRESLTRSDVHG